LGRKKVHFRKKKRKNRASPQERNLDRVGEEELPSLQRGGEIGPQKEGKIIALQAICAQRPFAVRPREGEEKKTLFGGGGFLLLRTNGRRTAFLAQRRWEVPHRQRLSPLCKIRSGKRTVSTQRNGKTKGGTDLKTSKGNRASPCKNRQRGKARS